jgi:OHCU decarboxylase
LKLDTASDAEFIATVAPLFEAAPRFLVRLARARPFGSADSMFDRALDIALTMPEAEQVELVDAHPRLGADPRSVSAMSYTEQGYDGMSRTSAELERLNDAYEERFGFRYCVFVAGRAREALIAEMRAALTADRDAELRRALNAVVDIARDRYGKLAGQATTR